MKLKFSIRICAAFCCLFFGIESYSGTKNSSKEINQVLKAAPISITGKLGLSVTDKETGADFIVAKIDRYTSTHKVYGEAENPKEITQSISDLFMKCSTGGREKEDCSVLIMYLDLGSREKNIELKHDKDFETKLKNDPEFRVKLNKMLGKPFTTSASNPIITAADVLRNAAP